MSRSRWPLPLVPTWLAALLVPQGPVITAEAPAYSTKPSVAQSLRGFIIQSGWDGAVGADGVLVRADVSRVDDVRRMFSEVRKVFGTLDVLVANARPEPAKFYQKPMEITLEAWDHAHDSQAKAFLVGVREAVDFMGPGG